MKFSKLTHNRPSVKFWIFENPRWLRPPSWKSQKSRYLRNGLTDLYEIWYAGAKSDWKPLWPLKKLNFTNPRWRTAAILKTVKLSYFCNRLTDFDEICHDDAYLPLTADRPLKFRIYENPRPRKYTTRVDPHVDKSHQVWRWYYHPLPSYSVFVCSYVTWPCDLDLWPFDLEQLPYMGVTWPTLPPSLNTLCLSVLDLWVITFPFGYHRECVRAHCACAESRDPWVGGQKQLHFWNSRPRFAYSLYNFPWATTTIKVVYSRASPMLKPLIA